MKNKKKKKKKDGLKTFFLAEEPILAQSMCYFHNENKK